jgi:hypothetical protein
VKEHADIVSVGFTGTQVGMTPGQEASVTQLLRVFQGHEFHHGGCVGSDVQAAQIARRLDYTTVRWPGNTPDKQGVFVDDETRDELPNLERNHAIVDETGAMIATPRQQHEVRRSGTWATIRYARKKGGPLYVVLPDGLVT